MKAKKRNPTRGARAIAIALGISAGVASPGANAAWMTLLIPLAQSVALKLMENSTDKEERARGVGTFVPSHPLKIDESVVAAFPELSAQEAVELKLELAEWIQGHPPELRGELLEALEKDLLRIQRQRSRLKAMSSFDRVRMAAETGSECEKLGESEANASLQLLESKLSPWPRDASEAWSEMCRKSLSKG